MCGIVGAIQHSESRVTDFLLDGLQTLEYRGYDSAGIVVVDDKTLNRVRVAGRVKELVKKAKNLSGYAGIGHTRWATHGVPSINNAHPLLSGSETDGVAVVHNGIIENHSDLHAKLSAEGFVFSSETDSEVIAHMLYRERAGGADLHAAMRKVTSMLEGAFAIAAITPGENQTIVCARRSSPLLIGKGTESIYLASDAPAIVSRSQELIWLEDGDCASINPDGFVVTNAKGQKTKRRSHNVANEGVLAIKLGEYRHFMQKEIFEQPDAIAATVVPALEKGLVPTLFGRKATSYFRKAQAVTLLACGTSYHAALLGARWIEELAKVRCTVHIASEFRNRISRDADDALVVAVSQSGETADTLAAIRTFTMQADKQEPRATSSKHVAKLAICNNQLSSLAHECDFSFITQAGTEIAVASTKTFVAQAVALLILAGAFAKARKQISAQQEEQILHKLRLLPFLLRKATQCESDIKIWADQLSKSRNALFLGRGAYYPLALEGALKLKEISYIHAAGYPAGELKHGPLALVDHEMPVIGMAPDDELLPKIQANLSEVASRNGKLFVLAGKKFAMDNTQIIRMPDDGDPMISPFVFAIALQLLSYHTARIMGTDIDKPRNLAKSVTVE